MLPNDQASYYEHLSRDADRLTRRPEKTITTLPPPKPEPDTKEEE